MQLIKKQYKKQTIKTKNEVVGRTFLHTYNNNNKQGCWPSDHRKIHKKRYFKNTTQR